MKITTAIDILAVDGKIAGPIAFHRGNTQGIRRPYKRETPTKRQLEVRANFKDVDDAWQALTPTLKQAWRDYESWRHNFGYNRFQIVNIPLGLQGLPFILDPANIP